MDIFKRKSIYLAVVAGLGAVGAAGTASAVNINSNGTGQVLIYPYYTVRGGTDTYLSVVNTTNSVKAVKVRFTEGKNSREVLDFNLYLSPQDVWTGAIVATTDGAMLKTTDKSCTFPAIPAGGKEFVNYAYTGSVSEGIVDFGGDGESQTLDRTREGYFEIIEMGVITNTSLAAAVTHNSGGTPANCGAVQTSTLNMSTSPSGNVGGQSPAVVAPNGGLTGTATLINVANGTDFSFSPVALSDFSDQPIWFPAGDIRPDMTSSPNPVSRIFKAGSVIVTNWDSSGIGATQDSVNAVSAVLMHDNIMNEYVLDTVTGSGTDWVITMPTKRYYVPVDASPLAQVVYPPFVEPFYTGGACESVSLTYYNREEQSTSVADFSPPQQGQGTSLCWETTVVTFNSTPGNGVLASVNDSNVSVLYENGWLNMAFAQTYSSSALAVGIANTPAGAHTYVGLPTVGFMVQDFVNGNVGGVLSNYGGNFDHNYTTLINGSAAE